MWQTATVRWRNGQQRVLRGGNWFNNDERNLRSAYRNHNEPDNRNDNIGLRLAGALPTKDSTGWSLAEGSVNQLSGNFAVWFKRMVCSDKPKGAGRVSKRRVDARTVESLPRCRFVYHVWCCAECRVTGQAQR